jgi:hypothetical protein
MTYCSTCPTPHIMDSIDSRSSQGICERECPKYWWALPFCTLSAIILANDPMKTKKEAVNKIFCLIKVTI